MVFLSLKCDTCTYHRLHAHFQMSLFCCDHVLFLCLCLLLHSPSPCSPALAPSLSLFLSWSVAVSMKLFFSLLLPVLFLFFFFVFVFLFESQFRRALPQSLLDLIVVQFTQYQSRSELLLCQRIIMHTAASDVLCRNSSARYSQHSSAATPYRATTLWADRRWHRQVACSGTLVLRYLSRKVQNTDHQRVAMESSWKES